MKIYTIPHPVDNFNVLYTCPRGEQICFEGLTYLYPEVELVNSPDEADYYLLNYVPHWEGEKWNYENLAWEYDLYKVIVVDWTDEHDRLLIPEYNTYFKRSWKDPNKKDNYKIQRNFNPISYCVLDSFPKQINNYKERQINLGCYLRYSCENRGQVLNYIHNISKFLNCQCSIGPVSLGSRSDGSCVHVDKEYFNMLNNTQLLVTCGPSQWCGDSRLWEALSQGCLVFMNRDDKVPLPNPLIDGVDYIEYDLDDLGTLRKKIRYYLDHPDEASEIAENGCNKVWNYHDSASRMEYVIQKVKENNDN